LKEYAKRLRLRIKAVLRMDAKGIATWELLQKKVIWKQLKYIHYKRVLDFGSGSGMTGKHFA
jgi:S-adenosylmethionine-dependent methyltransferase